MVERPPSVTVYLIRHAESRYNAAVKAWDVRALVGERDHGLSHRGEQQCHELSRTIESAASRGDADAQRLAASDRVTASSPLCRAVLTAHLALPNCASTSILALPSAREQCKAPVIARDSEGTMASLLQSHVDAELSRARAGGAGARKAAEVDVSRLPTDGAWWVVGEKTDAVVARLATLLRELYELASAGGGGTGGGAVVAISHSHAMRHLFRHYATPAFGRSERGAALGSTMVENCAVVRVRLELEAPGEPRIADAELLFGSTFRGKAAKAAHDASDQLDWPM